MLLQHFQVACRVAADTYPFGTSEKYDKIREMNYENSILVAQVIMDVINHIMGVVLSSEYIPCYSKLVRLILKEEAFFYSLVENPLFHSASGSWSSSSSENKNIRGYIVLRGEVSAMHFVGSSTSTRPQAKVDPAHVLWRTTLSALSSVLRLSSLASSDVSDDHSDWKTCFQYVLDFLSTYEMVVSSLLMSMTGDKVKTARNISNFSPPSNQLFTVNYLQELCDTLSFMSELFLEARYRNLLASSRPSFYDTFLSNLLEITRCLSTFVGSAAIARRLFSMLSHKTRRTSFDSPGMISRHYSKSLRDTNSSGSPFPSSSSSFMHGGGGGTMPNARHEAIGK